ncbi:leucine-rich repeat domain-containing protein [Wukongibacter sp. M2B1]|uniref:leucine-rich repeat domain-containing protein n=1 Tax=Wukongibacter sp. M2B1 TaxID=3088895 RepID=UPI003D7B93B5
MKKVSCLVLLLIIILTATVPVSAAEWDKETNVPLDKVWKVRFNMEIDTDTVNTGNIYITDSNGKRIDAYVNQNEDKKEVFIVSKEKYNEGESYYIHITKGVRSIDGKYIKEAVSKEFITSSINIPPIVIKEIEDQVMKEGEVVTIDLSQIFFDEDGDELEYEVTTGEVYGSIYRYTVEDLQEPLQITIGAKDEEVIVYDTFNVVLNEQINFEDSNIESAVREAIDKPSGEIYAKDVEEIEELSLSKKGISSLEGIEYLVGLKELKLAFNDISDIRPLNKLVNLETLDLKENVISDVYYLIGLEKLQYLDLKNNYIGDITAIGYLINLKELDLSQNRIVDVNPLSEFDEELILEIDKNPIEDYGPIEHLLDY